MNDLDPRLAPWVNEMRNGPRVRTEAVARVKEAVRETDRRASTFGLLSRGPASACIPVVMILALVAGVAWWAQRSPTQAQGTPLASAHFVIHLPQARHVTLLGDFNDWDATATPLDRSDDGLWSVLVPIAPGSVRYAFLVDGTEWRSDPTGAPAGTDFGRPTSIAYFAAPEQGR